MSQHERTGIRDLLFSSWHRARSTKRFLGPVRAAKLTMIDLDAVEYCYACNKPLALIEVKHHNARSVSMTVTRALAFMAGIDAYLVRYWPTDDGDDIAKFEVLRQFDGSRHVREMTPAEYAE